MDIKSISDAYEELSTEIDQLGWTLERLLQKQYALEQILDHYSDQETHDVNLQEVE